MNVLVMGGTRFNGRHLVLELIKKGHNVTIFNREQTKAEIPPEVHRLYGDRKNHQQLREALGREEYDCVIDMSAYVVDDVASVMEILEGQAGHYIFVSTGNVVAIGLPDKLSFDFSMEDEFIQRYGQPKSA